MTDPTIHWQDTSGTSVAQAYGWQFAAWLALMAAGGTGLTWLMLRWWDR